MHATGNSQNSFEVILSEVKVMNLKSHDDQNGDSNLWDQTTVGTI